MGKFQQPLWDWRNANIAMGKEEKMGVWNAEIHKNFEAPGLSKSNRQWKKKSESTLDLEIQLETADNLRSLEPKERRKRRKKTHQNQSWDHWNQILNQECKCETWDSKLSKLGHGVFTFQIQKFKSRGSSIMRLKLD